MTCIFYFIQIYGSVYSCPGKKENIFQEKKYKHVFFFIYFQFDRFVSSE